MDIPVPGGTVINENDRESGFLPELQNVNGNVDPEVHTAWKQHVISGFDQNKKMFDSILNAFLEPYWSTVWMYRILFAVGILSFVTAIILGAWKGVIYTIIFGGLSTVTFIAFFLNSPARALEQNIVFITWLGVIYNNYWVRQMYANNISTIQKDLDHNLKTTITQLNALVDKYNRSIGKRFDISKENIISDNNETDK